MRFKIDISSAKTPIVLGMTLIVIGLVLLTPVGEFLVKLVGYLSLVAGIVIFATCIYFWMARFRRHHNYWESRSLRLIKAPLS